MAKENLTERQCIGFSGHFGLLKRRVFNVPMELMDRQTALDMGRALGDLVAIDWKDRNGGWTEFIRIKVMIDISKPLRRIVKLVDREGIEVICALKYERLSDFCFTCGIIGHKMDSCSVRSRGTNLVDFSPQFGNWLRAAILPPSQGRVNWRNEVEEISTNANTNEEKEWSNTGSKDDSGQLVRKGRDRRSEQEIRSAFPAERRFHKIMRDGMGRFKSKRKRVRGSNGESVDDSPAKLAKRRLLDSILLSKAEAVEQPCQEP
ncbi:nucleolin-like [Gossypium australe]|uniref:Nucleolin-like n=1 Tax=Gossypium australe TaxID=47621 RepID=A0A5B6V1R8_9ROSI|nr:nucleolin-like [Gossypium australe]